MSTDALMAPERTKTREPSTGTSRLVRRIGRVLLAIIVLLFSLLTALPVILLFFVTSVPVLIACGLTALDVGIGVVWFRLERTPLVVIGAAAGLISVSILAVYASQVFAAAPAITTPGGIATLEQVELGGSQQWITVRGQNVNNPVLLFLAGGPGGSELVMTRRYLGELEQHFVVVNWDQPGTGKSYNAVAMDTLTPERYVSDAHELTLYLRDRFHQEKIYVLGESWGSILGIWLAQAYPELFHAFIGTGQMVNTTENDIMGYEFALDYLTQNGRTDQAEALRRSGPPPYTGAGMQMRYMAYFNVLNQYMNAHAHGEGVDHNLLFDTLRAPEYGLLDKVNWVRGLSEVFTKIYPQLADLDFMTQAARLDVPVYFIKGRWDVNAMTSLVEDYFAILEAPRKELIWFEDSAHTPLWDEPEHFVDVMVNTVLAGVTLAE